MAKVWVLVANTMLGRFFSAAGSMAPLEPLEILSHPEDRVPEREPVAPRPGGMLHTVAGGVDEKAAVKAQAAIHFAGILADRLETGRIEGEFAALALVAESDFMGLVTDRVSPKTRALVRTEIPADLTGLDPSEIRKLLPEKLYSLP